MDNNNFKWLVSDIYDSFFIKLYYKKDNHEVFCGTFDVFDIYNIDGEELNIEFANIDDITKFLTMGIVRFKNIEDNSDIIDIPFRNMYKLYKNSVMLGDKDSSKKDSSLDELEAFSIFDGTVVNKNYRITSYIIDLNKSTDSDLKKIMRHASKFSSLGMQDRFDAISDVNMINYQRIKKDNSQKRI